MKKLVIILLLLVPIMASVTGCEDESYLWIAREYRTYTKPSKETHSYYQIPDTGQTTSYATNDDGDNIGVPNAASYTDGYDYNATSDDIVIDDVTGLMWTRCFFLDDGTMQTTDDCSAPNPGRYTWSQAKAKCENLNYAGYTDWKLPTIHDLMTLSYFQRPISSNGATFEFIDDSIFPNHTNSTGFYWSRTERNYDEQTKTWFIDFKASTFSLINFDSPSNEYLVKCVRGN